MEYPAVCRGTLALSNAQRPLLVTFELFANSGEGEGESRDAPLDEIMPPGYYRA